MPIISALTIISLENAEPISSTYYLFRRNLVKYAREHGEWRYFSESELRTAGLRQKLKEIPPEESIVRNNVEASIFQLDYHYPNDKSRYRSLVKYKLWIYSRSLWINFVRMVNYTT